MANSKDLVTYDLQIEGSPFKAEFQILLIEVTNELNRVTRARVVMSDGSPAKADFPISANSQLEPGKGITLQAGYTGTNKTIFEGIITGLTIQNLPGQSPRLEIDCRDQAVKMTVDRKSAYFVKQKDSDIISTLIGNAGVGSDVKATDYQWPEVIQYYCTDWDFMLSRAEINGMYVMTDQNKVTVQPYKPTSAVATFTYGMDLFSFVTGIDARRQLSTVQSEGWSYKDQQLTTASGSEPSVPEQGNLTGKKLSSVASSGTFELVTTAPLESGPLKTWADARLTKSRYAMIRGTFKVQGTADVKPGDCIKLAGLGDRFNGTAFVSGIQHLVDDGQWYTEITTGIDDNWFVDRVDAEAPPAAGLLPGVSGLLNATVKKIDSDPDSETRIQVDIPVVEAAGDGVWARLANQYATSGAGYFWMPEVGDEVVVGFFNDDPRYPVILGSLYSSQKAPPLTPEAKNPKKAIYSKSLIYIEFDDENKVLTLTTPGENKIVFSDEDKSILVEDQNSNKIELNESGIKMTSPKDIEMQATGSVKITGTAGVEVTSDASMTLKATAELQAQGLSTEIKAETSLTLEGSAQAALKGGAEVQIQGAIVMIN